MKKVLLALLLLGAGPASAQEVTAPRFQGAEVSRFLARLSGEAEKIALEEEIPAAKLSPLVTVGFTVDTAGCVAGWRYLDNGCTGRDFRDLEPATPETRRVLERALARLERWTPARRADAPVDYPLTARVRIPVEKIARAQERDPLLFMGKDPRESFHEWALPHLRYRVNRELATEGRMSVLFRIEADGSITILETSDFPDPKYARDVVRVIKKSEGKWTPRKKDGVAVASEYRYNVYLFAE